MSDFASPFFSDRNPKTVLIVCNDPTHKIIWRLLFTRAGLNVLEAKGLDTTLPFLDTQKPDLIVLTYWLHGKANGVELCAILRQRSKTAQTPILLASASSNQDAIDRAMKAGVTRYISLPFNHHEFMTTLESILA
jgi:two-component system OmpR family response regulator